MKIYHTLAVVLWIAIVAVLNRYAWNDHKHKLDVVHDKIHKIYLHLNGGEVIMTKPPCRMHFVRGDRTYTFEREGDHVTIYRAPTSEPHRARKLIKLNRHELAGFLIREDS